MTGTMMKGVAAVCFLALAAAGGASAQQQECTEDQFGSTTGQLYLKAENQLMVEDNPQGALQALNELRSMELNCYEEGAVLRLSAAVKVQSGDYAGAVNDLKAALDRGYVAEKDKASTYFNIAQLYLQDEKVDLALDYMERWINAGGQPDRDQKWQLAVLYQRADQNQEALKWAEQVFEQDGPNAKREVYDFLIYLYDKTGQYGKKAQLLQQLLARNPNDRKIWDAIAGEFFRADELRMAFEVQKAMYLAGFLTKEDEIMRIVNFYNQFDVPYEAAKTLEKEMNAGRIEKDFEKLETLANLYQVAREYQKAIPVIEEAANMGGAKAGAMYERLGRSYAELKEWENAERALTRAINAGGLNDPGSAWVLIGQARYELGNIEGAVEAFENANNRGGRGWLAFIESEKQTARALECFDIQSAFLEVENERKACKRLSVLGENLPDNCKTVDERFEERKSAWQDSGCQGA